MKQFMSKSFCLGLVVALLFVFMSTAEAGKGGGGGKCSDKDGDGYFKQSSCGTEEDCNDNDSAIFPGATEECTDGIDNDCDGLIDVDDPNAINCTGCIDNDGDGYGVGGDCLGPDCDDTNPEVNPGLVERCFDGIDNNCNGKTDGEDQDTCTGDCTDADGDNFGVGQACLGPDCNDNDAAVNPDAAETCNGIDDDCNGLVDEGFDLDGDGYTSCGGDCDDSNPDINPGADDSLCNGIDENCDGIADDAYMTTPTTCGAGLCAATGQLECQSGQEVDTCSPGTPQIEGPSGDATCGDGIDNDCDDALDGDDADCTRNCVDNDNDGYGSNGSTDCPGGALTDCNDNDPTVHPNASDTNCNGIDENCDGTADDGYVPGPSTCGSGICSSTGQLTCVDGVETDSCVPGTPQTEGPSGDATCSDGIDNDCDDLIDGADAHCWTACVDFDEDGYGANGDPSCPNGPAVDCNDEDPSVFPGAPEPCDGVDNNCDGTVDEGFDADGDTYTTCAGDCNDSDPAINPGAAEGPDGDSTCSDGIDNDCDGTIDLLDNSCLDPSIDHDGDGLSINQGDCDDTDNKVYPGAPRLCDGKDNNCDGRQDFKTDEEKDGDGVPWCAGDCDDFNPQRFPGNPEVCNGIDDDCNSIVPSAELDFDQDGFRLCDDIPDCNDLDATSYPGAPEICSDGADNDCDGTTDEDPPEDPCICPDFDGDGQQLNLCGGQDCNDQDDTVYLGAPELCTDGKDNDCDGIKDIQDSDAIGCPPYCVDGDVDNYYTGGVGCGPFDCDDTDNRVFPGAHRGCDGKDSDCDGRKDFSTDEDKDQDGAMWCGGDCDDNNPMVSPANREARFGDPICSDGMDNDCDTRVDGADSGCAVPSCNTKTSPKNGPHFFTLLNPDDTTHPDNNALECGKCHVSPNYDDPVRFACQRCHADPADPSDPLNGELRLQYPLPKPYGFGSAPVVKMHSSDIVGSGYGNWTMGAKGCVTCHNPHTQEQNNIYGTDHGMYIKEYVCYDNDATGMGYQEYIEFNAPSGSGSFADGPPHNENICEMCHTMTNWHRRDGSTPVHNDGDDCVTCHPHDTGFAPTGGKADTPHDTGRFEVECELCHVTRTDYTSPIPDDKCNQCHSPGGAEKANFPTAPDVLTHSDTNGSGLYAYNKACIDCHNPMYPQPNILHVRGTIDGVLGPGPVEFNTFTNSGSFADGPPHNENICEKCHSAANHHWYDGNAPADSPEGTYIGHFDSQDCRDCHTHQGGFADQIANTLVPAPHDGLACEDCHATDAQGRLQDAYPGAPLPNSTCEFCHGIDSTGPSILKVQTHYSPTTIDPTTGTLLNALCVECHNPMRVQINYLGNMNMKFIREQVRGRDVAFEAYIGSKSFADGDSICDGICEVCHTQTNHHRNNCDPLYQSHNDAQDCRQCHSHPDGFQPGIVPPPPHDIFDCEVCHDPGTYVPGADIPNTKCDTCHAPGTPLRNEGGSDTKVDTHYSTSYIDPTTGQLLNLNCVECHNPMSLQTNFRANTNLSFIRDTIRGNQIVFEARTGPYSFADDVNTPADMTSANYVCNTCHTQTAYHRSDGSMPPHNDGADCTGCHPHPEGFLPTGATCLDCHNQSPPAGSTDVNRRQVVEGTAGDGGGDFVRVSHHVVNGPVTTQVVTETDCLICHNQSQHQNFGDGVSVLLNDQDNAGNTITYNGPAAAEPFCAGCHDADGSLVNGPQPFSASGDANSPVDIGWMTGVMAHSAPDADACLGCHGNVDGPNGHGSDNLKILQFSFNAATSQSFCYNCHDGSASTMNVLAAYSQNFNHAAGNENCVECHDQHLAEPGLHIAGSTSLSDMIGGVNAGLGFNYQYELCFQCHNAPITKNILASETEMDTSFGGGNVYRTNWNVTPNVQSQFSTTNLAYHPLLLAGLNQPDEGLNSEWTTSSYRKDDNAPGGPFAGLDNNFVDGWVANSLVTCSDCHDNGGVGARGPHGSAQPWILNGIDRTVAVTTAGSGIINPNADAPTDPWIEANFCVNCHRADIHGWGSDGPGINNQSFSRIDHRGGSFSTNCQKTDNEGTGGFRNIGCLNCHGGAEVGGMHGTNIAELGQGTIPIGRRFMNGNSRDGLDHVDGKKGPQVTCYTSTSPPPLNVNLSSCTQHGGGSSTKSFNYDY